jgi:coenzyme F420-reducing hydrogenase delta subunit
MNPKVKQRLIASAAVGVILASCAWIYFTQIKSARHNVGLHQKIGEVLAERSAELVGKKGRLVTISISTKDWPELKTQIDAFKKKLKRLGAYELREYEMDTKDQPKYGVGSGLSGRRYVRTVKKNPNADLFVSFVGAPKLTNDEAAELGKKPRLIAESRSGDNLPALFERKLIEVAVVSRFEFPAPGPEKPTTPEGWFVKRYQVLTADPGDKLSKAE